MHKQREGVWEHAPPAQSRFSDFFLFDVSSATWKSANSHASDTQTHALTCRLHTSLLTQTRCRQKIKRDLLKVGGQQVRDIGGLGDAVVLFLVCVCDAWPFISGDVIPSSCSAPMLPTLHLRFDVPSPPQLSSCCQQCQQKAMFPRFCSGCTGNNYKN